MTESEEELYEERAAIREFDGLMPRAVAEKKAREDVKKREEALNELCAQAQELGMYE